MTGARPYGLILGRNISAARGRLQLSQGAVAARMRALGFQWQQQTLAAVEKAKRRPTAEEIFGLAVALEVSIPLLMTASDQNGFVEFPNGHAIHSSSVERLAGRGLNDHAVQWPDGGNSPVFLAYTERPTRDAFDRELFGPAMAAQGWPGDREAQQPVVAAIVTSGGRVLITKRVDGVPPWGFVSGEVEPGERPEDAAIRETKEETGLEVGTGRKIGERTHPETGRVMIYLAAKPVGSTEAFVADRAELAEVKWASLAEADELLPGMFGPVRQHLAAELGGEGES